MSYRYRFILLVMLILTTAACSVIPRATPPTETAIPATDTPGATATDATSRTPVPTDTTRPSSTPIASDTPVLLTATINAAIAQQTQMVGTSFAQFGSMAHLSGYLIYYSNPIGTPVKSWHDIPIMKEATAGQEFQPDIYSYKAAATLKQGTNFYTSASTSLNWSCFPTATGSGGTGSQATQSATLLCGSLTIIISSFDNDTDHVLVILNKAP